MHVLILIIAPLLCYANFLMGAVIKYFPSIVGGAGSHPTNTLINHSTAEIVLHHLEMPS